MNRTLSILIGLCLPLAAWAQDATVSSPDNRLRVDVTVKEGGDFTRGLTFAGAERKTLDETYRLDRIKQSEVYYRANELTVSLKDAAGRTFDVVFRVSNNDVAFRYELPRFGETGSIVIEREATGFDRTGSHRL